MFAHITRVHIKFIAFPANEGVLIDFFTDDDKPSSSQPHHGSLPPGVHILDSILDQPIDVPQDGL